MVVYVCMCVCVKKKKKEMNERESRERERESESREKYTESEYRYTCTNWRRGELHHPADRSRRALAPALYERRVYTKKNKTHEYVHTH